MAYIGSYRTYTNGDADVLCEQDALEFDNEEVAQLNQILHDALQGLARNLVVLLRSHLRRKAFTKRSPTHDFGGRSDAQNHPCRLQEVASNWNIARSDDEDGDGRI